MKFHVGQKLICTEKIFVEKYLNGNEVCTVRLMEGNLLWIEEDNRQTQDRWLCVYFKPYVEPPPGIDLYEETPEIAEIRASFIAKGEVNA